MVIRAGTYVGTARLEARAEHVASVVTMASKAGAYVVTTCLEGRAENVASDATIVSRSVIRAGAYVVTTRLEGCAENVASAVTKTSRAGAYVVTTRLEGRAENVASDAAIVSRSVISAGAYVVTRAKSTELLWGTVYLIYNIKSDFIPFGRSCFCSDDGAIQKSFWIRLVGKCI